MRGGEGAGAAVAEPPAADINPKRLVAEGEIFDVCYDTHVDAVGHCKGRTFEHRMKAKYVGIPRCLHHVPSHHTQCSML